MSYKIGDIVKWCWSDMHQNTYIIVDLDSRGAILKQNFGRGTVLNGRVSIVDLSKKTTQELRDEALSKIIKN